MIDGYFLYPVLSKKIMLLVIKTHNNNILRIIFSSLLQLHPNTRNYTVSYTGWWPSTMAPTVQASGNTKIIINLNCRRRLSKFPTISAGFLEEMTVWLSAVHIASYNYSVSQEETSVTVSTIVGNRVKNNSCWTRVEYYTSISSESFIIKNSHGFIKSFHIMLLVLWQDVGIAAYD